jgi:hypothetical protein
VSMLVLLIATAYFAFCALIVHILNNHQPP